MCVAIPAKVVALEAEGMATVSFRGVRRSISVAFVEDVVLDDYLLVHADHALRKVSETEAVRTLELMTEAGLLTEEMQEIGKRPV